MSQAMLQIDQIFPHADATLRAMLEAAPAKRMSVINHNDFDESLTLKDPRFVHTTAARGEEFRKNFFSQLCYDEASGEFDVPQGSKHVLFFGHVGCGKSTELAHLCAKLEAPERYWVLRVDLLKMLDPSNVSYSDVWLAVALELVKRLNEEKINIPQVVVNGLQNWFTEQILTHDRIKEFSSEIKAEAKITLGLPYLASLLGSFTGAIKNGSSHRESIRTVVHNTYGQFIQALNTLFIAATDELKKAGKAQQLLILIDGTDRFSSDSWRKFFVEDGNLLTQAQCITVYSAPLALKAAGKLIASFHHVTLPMIKLREFDALSVKAGAKRPLAYDCMREMILKRCHYSLFDSLATLDAMIDLSGGHMRDALHLLTFACSAAQSTPFTLPIIEKAGQRMASDFNAWLEKEDFAILVQEDLHPRSMGKDERIRQLIQDGALLEYNEGSWRQCHPAIKTLPGYLHALNAIE